MEKRERRTIKRANKRTKRKKCIQLSNENAVFIAKLSIENAIKYDNFIQIEWLPTFFFHITWTNVYPIVISFFVCVCSTIQFFFCATLQFENYCHRNVEKFRFFAQLPIGLFGAYLTVTAYKKMLFKFAIRVFFYG